MWLKTHSKSELINMDYCYGIEIVKYGNLYSIKASTHLGSKILFEGSETECEEEFISLLIRLDMQE